MCRIYYDWYVLSYYLKTKSSLDHAVFIYKCSNNGKNNWQEYCNLQEVFCASNAHYIKRNKILELILEDVSLKN